MSTTTIRDLGRGLLRPRFLIAAFIVTALVTMGMHRQRLLNEEVDIMRQDFEINGKVNRHFSDAAEVARKVQSSELLYQKQVKKRIEYIRENNADVGAWFPKAKEMMPLWWYFQPSFNCPYEVERVGRFNDGGK
ncbi:hypothetical protein BG015_005693, partial [Linnemannia schmuckeri]